MSRTRCVVLSAIAATFLLALPAAASAVQYTTTGTFSAGSTLGTNVYTDPGGQGTITFTGVPNGIQTGQTGIGPTLAGMGLFNESVTATGFTPSGDFTLNITQINPSSASGGISGALNGVIQSDSSGLFIDFSGTGSVNFGGNTYATVVIGGTTYGVLAHSPINAPSTGTTTLQGYVAAPEPTFYGLTAIGFAGLLAMAIRRKRQNNAVA